MKPLLPTSVIAVESLGRPGRSCGCEDLERRCNYYSKMNWEHGYVTGIQGGFTLDVPMQLSTQGQWWSNFATQRLHAWQCLERSGRRTWLATRRNKQLMTASTRSLFAVTVPALHSLLSVSLLPRLFLGEKRGMKLVMYTQGSSSVRGEVRS